MNWWQRILRRLFTKWAGLPNKATYRRFRKLCKEKSVDDINDCSDKSLAFRAYCIDHGIKAHVLIGDENIAQQRHALVWVEGSGFFDCSRAKHVIFTQEVNSTLLLKGRIVLKRELGFRFIRFCDDNDYKDGLG